MSQEYAYYWLIIHGDRTINDVPSLIRQKVIELLQKNGYKDLTTSDKSGII